MGTYLSKPVTEKDSEEGQCHSMRFGVSAMQGWRRSMEDEHVATTLAVPDRQCGLRGTGQPPRVSMFAVFDGHGGKEVAKFCKAHMAEELVGLREFQEGNVRDALVRVFHRIDDMLWDPSAEAELDNYKRGPSSGSEQRDGAALTEAGEGDESEMRPRADSLSSKEVMEMFRQMLIMSEQSRTAGGQASQHGGPGEPSPEAGDDAAVHDEEPPRPHVPVEAQRPPSSLERPELLDEGRDDPEAAQPLGSNGGAAPRAAANTFTPTGGRRALTEPASRDGVCNLPNVRVTAGCTSVVAVVIDQVVHVANAGDSRAVLCRGGRAVALSEDHKPMNERELARIQAVGGFVNENGRVNGNLNLSRSIGDLKYKQADVPPAEQMITADPDVLTMTLTPEDEFMILACDGIWDCLSNQEAVDFVRERLQRGLSPRAVAEEALDACLSEDPRQTTGIGGDNMTCIVVQLN